MSAIKNMELITHHGPLEEAPKTFELNIFFDDRKAPRTIWLRTSMTVQDLISSLLEFVKIILYQ